MLERRDVIADPRRAWIGCVCRYRFASSRASARFLCSTPRRLFLSLSSACRPLPIAELARALIGCSTLPLSSSLSLARSLRRVPSARAPVVHGWASLPRRLRAWRTIRTRSSSCSRTATTSSRRNGCPKRTTSTKTKWDTASTGQRHSHTSSHTQACILASQCSLYLSVSHCCCSCFLLLLLLLLQSRALHSLSAVWSNQQASSVATSRRRGTAAPPPLSSPSPLEPSQVSCV